MSAARGAVVGLLLLAATRLAIAQAVPEVRLEGGLAHVRQPGDAAATALLLGISWRRPTQRWTFLSSANLTLASDSLAAAHGVAAISIPWSVSERLSTEFGLAGASFSLRTAGRGGNANFFTRQHLVGPNRGIWIGGGVARSSRDGIASKTAALDAGAWQRLGALYFSGSVVRQATSDLALLLSSGVPGVPGVSRFHLFDAQFAAQLRNGPHELTASVTTREGVQETDAHFIAFSASAVAQITERVAFIAGGGRQLADPLRGLPQADIFTLAARVSFGPQPLPVLERSVIAQALVQEFVGGGGELTVRVFANDTMQVSVAGDFSDWQPIPLTREGAFFVGRVRLEPGKYRVAVRVNRGAWRAPRNLARVRDDYGGESGLVVIP